KYDDHTTNNLVFRPGYSLTSRVGGFSHAEDPQLGHYPSPPAWHWLARRGIRVAWGQNLARRGGACAGAPATDFAIGRIRRRGLETHGRRGRIPGPTDVFVRSLWQPDDLGLDGSCRHLSHA